MIEFDEEAARKVREKELAQRGVQQSKANEQAEKKRKSALAQVKELHEAYLNKVKQDNYVNSKRLYDCSGIFSEMDKALSDKTLCWEVMNFSDWHRGSKSKKNIYVCKEALCFFICEEYDDGENQDPPEFYWIIINFEEGMLYYIEQFGRNKSRSWQAKLSSPNINGPLDRAMQLPIAQAKLELDRRSLEEEKQQEIKKSLPSSFFTPFFIITVLMLIPSMWLNRHVDYTNLSLYWGSVFKTMLFWGAVVGMINLIRKILQINA